MNELSLPQNLSDLDKSIFLARHIDTAVNVLRPLVYKIFSEKLWEGRFSSFSEYVESSEGLGKSQGYASKLNTIEKFRIDRELSEREIAGIDYESIYLAIKSGGTTMEIVEKARTLTRAELRQERSEQNDHTHEAIQICKHCSMRM